MLHAQIDITGMLWIAKGLDFVLCVKVHKGTEMNDGVYFDQNGNEVIVINRFEYSREEFDSLVNICGDCNI